MSSSQPPKRFQEILRQRQQSSFVGRSEQVALFRQNSGFALAGYTIRSRQFFLPGCPPVRCICTSIREAIQDLQDFFDDLS